MSTKTLLPTVVHHEVEESDVMDIDDDMHINIAHWTPCVDELGEAAPTLPDVHPKEETAGTNYDHNGDDIVEINPVTIEENGGVLCLQATNWILCQLWMQQQMTEMMMTIMLLVEVAAIMRN